MRFRDGLLAARGHIIWIFLLALSSALILKLEAAAPQEAAALSATP